MKKSWIVALCILGFGLVTGATLLYAGMVDVAADSPHTPIVYRFIAWVRECSIDNRSAGIVPPADLVDAERIRRGAGNYDAMCVGCHLSPGAEDSEIRRGLYPQPPNLTQPANVGVDANRAAARRFWIIKHGIKASGMPAWAKGGMEDQAIWDLTAFLAVLPTLSAEQYRHRVEISEGHSHGGLDHHHNHSDLTPDDAHHGAHAEPRPHQDHSAHTH